MVLRDLAGTVRAVAARERFEAVQASAMPISTPAPMMSVTMPVAKSVTAIPAAKLSAPPTISGRMPKRSPIAPMNGWVKPQTMFCTASAKVKSLTVKSRSRVIGTMKRPRLWRMPMPRLIKIEAPATIVSIWARVACTPSFCGAALIDCLLARVSSCGSFHRAALRKLGHDSMNLATTPARAHAPSRVEACAGRNTSRAPI